MGIYLLDVFGMKSFSTPKGAGCYDPLPLAPRPCPRSFPSARGYGKPTRMVLLCERTSIGGRKQGGGGGGGGVGGGGGGGGG
jgi:hypothetical protein